MAASRRSSSLLWALLALVFLLSIGTTAGKRGPKTIWYKAQDVFPEGVAYDAKHDRFLVGSLKKPAITAVNEDGSFSEFVTDPEFEGKAFLGTKVDEPRNRVVTAVSSISPEEIFAAVVAYDLDTAERVLYVRLDDVTTELPADPEDPDYIKPPSVATDVAVDPKGNLYVTNTLSNFLWKVGADGVPSVLTADPLFTSLPIIYQNKISGVVGLNGIDYHPKGFLLVGHTSAGALFKVAFSVFTSAVTVSVVNLDEPIAGVDGIAIRPDGKVVAAGVPAVYLVESNDNWASAKLVETVPLKEADAATAVALKDSQAYVSLSQLWRAQSGKSSKWFELRPVEFKADGKIKKKATKPKAMSAKKGAKTSTQSAVPVVLISGGLLALLALALAKDKGQKKA